MQARARDIRFLRGLRCLCIAGHRWSHTGSLHRSSSKFYFVMNDLVGPQLWEGMRRLHVAGCSRGGTALAVTAAFNDLRYRGVYSAILITEIE
jgi:hypothetical protein